MFASFLSHLAITTANYLARKRMKRIILIWLKRRSENETNLNPNIEFKLLSTLVTNRSCRIRKIATQKYVDLFLTATLVHQILLKRN